MGTITNMFLIMDSYINGYYYLLVDLEDCYLFAQKVNFLWISLALLSDKNGFSNLLKQFFHVI